MKKEYEKPLLDVVDLNLCDVLLISFDNGGDLNKIPSSNDSGNRKQWFN